MTAAVAGGPPALDYDDTYTDLLKPNALRIAALRYAAAGIPVFPLIPRGKTPATANGFKNATTDRDKVMHWWTTTPQANIGTPTGHGFDVIDLDGWPGIQSWLERFPSLTDFGLPLIGHAVTPRGGGHHLYVRAEPWRKNGTRLLPGVDCRAAGGYVVAPPSRGANGRLYRWLTPLTLGGDR